jgi:ribosomal protein L11 methyltransferase
VTLALVLSVPAVEAELAADALWALGVAAVEERTLDGPTEGSLVELWTSLGDDHSAVARAAEAFPARWRWRLVEVDPTVHDEWRRHAVPTWVSQDLMIHPAWVPVEVDAGVTTVSIEPGASFGLGDHPTTVLTLRAVRKGLFPGATVLDVGCGSGVVAIAACLLGASRAVALDVSPAAVEATSANASANGVDSRIEVSTTPLASVPGEFDVVAANILAPVLVELGSALVDHVGPDGVLVLSGLLDGRYDHVVEAVAPLHLVDVDRREGWVALTFRR